jgi:hypothetical protein
MHAGSLVVAVVLALYNSLSLAVQNPDQITVFFPAFEGPGKLGLNVSTVLSLQLAQTTRRHPWPHNPEHHDFGEGIIRWSSEPLATSSISDVMKIAQANNLLAQIVVAGNAVNYGKDVVVDLNIALPEYRRAPSTGCSASGDAKCDFRQKNFEVWQIKLDDRVVEVDVPKRYFGISAIVLKPEVIQKFSTASGLAIRDKIAGGDIIGETGDYLRFIEFNKHLPGAPTKIRSQGVEGYVTMPELSDEVSEFADMVGGILQVYRGDWEEAIRSFNRVIDNPKTRVPLKVDALLYRGMAKFKNSENGYSDVASAAKLAPYDATVTRYYVMALIASGSSKESIADVLEKQSYLFDDEDEWYDDIHSWLEES